MLFNTLEFLIFFITVTTIIFAVTRRQFQHVFLLLASYFFFYYSSNYLIVLLIFTTIWDFYFGREIWKSTSFKRKKLILLVSLAGNLGLLGFFKYVDFAITQFNFFGHYLNFDTNIPLLNLVLPIGISFYTFHSITYTVSIYRGQIAPAKSLTEYAIFVTFFPQLVAGPILRAKDFLPQLREKIKNFEINPRLRLIVVNNNNLKLGVTLMAFGFLKKMFFADNIAPMVNELFTHPLGLESFQVILAAIGFGIQIYGDFSGYSDIALGSALILGFKIPVNFNKPYFATSPSDFWQRWHMSLSSWLRDYLYITLGGNRKGKVRTYLNLFITMFLGGLWHGASWNFVIWGLLHGAYLAIHKMILNKFPKLENHSFFKKRIGFIISILITQYLVFLAWIAFRVKETDYIIYCFQKYVFLDFAVQKTMLTIMANKLPISLMILFIGLHYISYKKNNLLEIISGLKLRYWFMFLTVIIVSILVLYNGNPEDFIYFRF